jgi:hypothetical protein
MPDGARVFGHFDERRRNGTPETGPHHKAFERMQCAILSSRDHVRPFWLAAEKLERRMPHGHMELLGSVEVATFELAARRSGFGPPAAKHETSKAKHRIDRAAD